MDKPKVVAICGSSRFLEVMAVCAWLIERQEGSVTVGYPLLPSRYHGVIPESWSGQWHLNVNMDELHSAKIDVADEVFVVNCEEYLGVRTQAQVMYALAHDKNIRWYTHDPIGRQVAQMIALGARGKEEGNVIL